MAEGTESGSLGNLGKHVETNETYFGRKHGVKCV
jgi:hypothetical protein